MKEVSRGNLDDVVATLRPLGYADKASELIACYIEVNRNHITAVDDSANPFHSFVKDDEFRAALSAALVPLTPKPMKDVFADINTGSFKSGDIAAAQAMSVEDFYALFKGLQGDELHRVIEGSLFYKRVVNADDAQKEMTRRSLEALKRIGRESSINAVRVRRYSVIINEEDGSSADEHFGADGAP